MEVEWTDEEKEKRREEKETYVQPDSSTHRRVLRTPICHDIPPKPELALHNVVEHFLVLAGVGVVDQVCEFT